MPMPPYAYNDWTGGGLMSPQRTRFEELKSPDQVPSSSIHGAYDRKQDIVEILEIKDDHGGRLGALVIPVRGHPVTGKLIPQALGEFTKEEIDGHAGHAKNDARVQTRDSAQRQ